MHCTRHERGKEKTRGEGRVGGTYRYDFENIALHIILQITPFPMYFHIRHCDRNLLGTLFCLLHVHVTLVIPSCSHFTWKELGSTAVLHVSQ